MPDLGDDVVRAAVVLPAAALLAVSAFASGCLEPHQVQVDAAILEQAPGWVATPGGVEGDFGLKSQETRYAFDRDPDAPPPFAGSLQVFSIRSLGRLETEELLDRARELVATGAEENNILLDDGEQAGRRTLESGVPTRWFFREGRTAQSGDVFDQDVTVRILGEVGHDGRSDTSFLVIAMAQLSRTNQCPLIGPCQPVETDLHTWIQVVGDREASIDGATSTTGFIDHLVTR